MSGGYSKTKLAKKLGIKDGFYIILQNEPKHYFNLFEDFPSNVHQISLESEKLADFIHLFLNDESELDLHFNSHKQKLKKDGLMWISWPKANSLISTNLKRDPIRAYGLANGLVDTKVAAIDEDWSGLKFVFRLKDR